MRLPRYTKPPGLFRLIDWPQGFQLWITLRLLFTGRIYFVQTLTGKPLLVWGVFTQGQLYVRKQRRALVRFIQTPYTRWCPVWRQEETAYHLTQRCYGVQADKA